MKGHRALWTTCLCIGIAFSAFDTCAQVVFQGGEDAFPQLMDDQVEMMNPSDQPGILDSLNGSDRAIILEAGASESFIRQFDDFSTYLTNHDMAAAATALEGLQAETPYETTWLNLARFQLEARQGGSPARQMQYLLQTFEAAESIRGLILLPKEVETTTRRKLLQLQIQTNHLHEALGTYALMEAKEDVEGVAAFQSLVRQVEELATNDVSYPVVAELDTAGKWQLALHKRQFYIDEVVGKVGDAAIVCDEKSQTLTVEPLLGYALPAALGGCVLVFTGDPGTRFVVIQYRD